MIRITIIGVFVVLIIILIQKMRIILNNKYGQYYAYIFLSILICILS